MNRRLLPLLVFCLGLPPSLSANPYTLQYGGRLAGNSGRPVSGPVSMTINFFNSASGNNLLANQSFSGVVLKDGVFNLTIELSPTSFESVFSSSEVWIEVVDHTNGKLYPRQRFGAVPYAFKVPTDGLTLGYDATGKLRVQGLGPAALPSGNPSDGQILKWKDGTGWEWGADNSGGTGTGSVDSTSILDGSISNADVAGNAAIAGSKIAPNFGAQNIVTTGTISGDGSGLTNLPAGPLGSSIDGSEIANGSISDTHIAAGAAIDPSKINGLTTALAAREGTITAGTGAQYFKGDKTWATLDTAAVPENVNLYYTDARARAALSAVAPLSYNSSTGAFSITSASGVSAGTISAAEFLAFSAKQAAITAASTVNTGTLTTALQSGVEINPYGTNAGESGELRFRELTASGSNYIGFKAPDTIAADKIYVLPAADGSVGQFLSTDGAGNLSWDSVGGAAGGTVTSITAGTGLSGGTITGSGTINLANTAVTPNSYTRANITVDAQGRLTAASNGSSVNLTSEVNGTLPLASGGTGATTAGDARTALGLGGLATQSSVNLATETTGTLALASGGTGATTAAAARTALGLGGLATLSAVGSTEIADASIANADIAAAAGIVDTKLDTISTAGKVSNSATTASSANTASAIVTRDSSGDFSAGTISANLIGNASTATSAGSVSGTVAIANGGTGATTDALARTALGLGTLATANSVDLATATTGSLSITSGGTGATTAGAARTNLGLGGLATLSAVGGGEITDDSIANADISSAAAIVDTKLATISTAGKVSNSATTAASANTASAIVARDGSGNFSAGTITATLSGNASTATTAGNVTGTIAIANGGTGATTAELARTALGLGSLATLSTVGSGDITDAAIANVDISASAAIEATKIADGSVSSAEFQYINSLTSDAQTQLNAKVSAANPSFTGVISAPLGAVGAPSYTFTGDPNTGVWSSSADTLDFSTAGANRLSIDSSGNVGIGTTDPSSRLTLDGETIQYPIAIKINPTAHATSRRASIMIDDWQIFQDTSGNGMKNFGIWQTAALENRFVIDTNGNVGIGVTEPNASLQVYGGIMARGGAPGSNGANNNGYSFAGNSGDNDSGMYSLSNDNLSFYTTALERLRIDGSGNVGIGTTIPVSSVEIYTNAGGALGSILTLSNSTAATGSASAIDFRASNWSQPIGARIMALDNSWSNDLIFYNKVPGATGNSLSETMRIAAGGNVGIGTTLPTAKLHVGGTPGTDGIKFPDGSLQTSASTTHIYGTAVLGGTVGLTLSNNTYQNTGLSITLPSAGTYTVRAIVRTWLHCNNTVDSWFTGMFYNSTDSAYITNSESSLNFLNANQSIQVAAPMESIITVAAAKTIRLHVKRAGCTSWNLSSIFSDDNGRTTLSYTKISN